MILSFSRCLLLTLSALLCSVQALCLVFRKSTLFSFSDDSMYQFLGKKRDVSCKSPGLILLHTMVSVALDSQFRGKNL